MKRMHNLTALLALALLLAPATARAGEAIEALKGTWVAESFDGEPAPEGVKMVLTFVDDATLRMEVTLGGETQKQEIKYAATADGKITLYPEPDTAPEGEKATWQVKDDKKLYLTNDQNEVMVLKRVG